MTHPAIFPEALARDHILSWSNPGDVVLSPFCGIGSEGYMAVKAKRKFVGIELKESYWAASCVNLEGAAAQKDFFSGE